MSNFVPKIRIDLYMQSLKLIFSAFLVLCLAACGSSADKGDKKAMKVGPGMPINAESFPDVNLQKFFLAQGYGADGAITDQEFESVTMLDLTGMQLQSLKGIERFPHLTVLKVTSNLLPELVMPVIPTLEVLYCADCGMQRIDLKGCLQLRELHCQENSLDSLIINEMPQLTLVEANNNRMKKVAFANCPQLRSINLASNKLSAADLSQCSALYDLDVTDNPLQIENVDVDAFVKNLPKATATPDSSSVHNAPTIVGLDEGSLSNNNKKTLQLKGWTLK